MPTPKQLLLTLSLLSLLPLALYSQTLVQEAQLSPPPVNNPSIRAIMPDGTVRYIEIGAGLQLNTSVAPFRLEAVNQTPAQSISLTTIRLISQGNNVWNWTEPGVLGSGLVVLARNGLVMLPGLDYTVNGQSVVFSAAQGSAPENVVTAVFAVVTQTVSNKSNAVAPLKTVNPPKK
jgi:hypothetical protein